MGDQFDASKMMSFGARSFASLDPSMHHYAAASGDRYESLHGLRKQRKSPTSIGRFRQSRAKSATQAQHGPRFKGKCSPVKSTSLSSRPSPEQLCDALGACTELNAVYRRLLKMALEELRLIDEQIGRLDQEMASLLSEHQDAVQRLAEVPGLGVDSAQQIIAEVGPTATTFPSEKCLSPA